MIEIIKMHVEMSNLRMENARLKAHLAQEKAMNRAFLSDVEYELQKRIHAIKCRDEVPNNIFLGKKEWDALKSTASMKMGATYTGDFEYQKASYCGFNVMRVKHATFVDVSTVQ